MEFDSAAVANIENAKEKYNISCKVLQGDIVKIAQKHDMIVNPWDPHSLPGNGNDNDLSFDGVMGKHAALGTQAPHLNPFLSNSHHYVAVKPRQVAAAPVKPVKTGPSLATPAAATKPSATPTAAAPVATGHYLFEPKPI